jgi:hypothetical protein
MPRHKILIFLFVFSILPAMLQCDSGPRPAADDETLPLGERVTATLTEPDPRLRTALLPDLLESLGPDDTAGLVDALDDERAYVDEVATVLVGAWWTEHDPQAAFDSGPQRWGHGSTWIATVSREWARHDPHAALEAVKRIPEAGESRRLAATRALTQGWFGSNAAPDELLSYIEGIHAGRSRNEVLHIFANRLVMRDGTAAAVELVDRTPPDSDGDNFKTQLVRYVTSAVASEDPLLAVALADEHGTGRKGQHLRRRVGQSWARHDGAGAMAWARALPAGEEREDVVRSAYRSWTRRDRESAMAWMRIQQPDPALEPAMRVFIVTVANDDPPGALDWMDRIEDPKRREETLAEIGRRWMLLDPEAADAWLEGVDLPEDVKSSIAQRG